MHVINIYIPILASSAKLKHVFGACCEYNSTANEPTLVSNSIIVVGAAIDIVIKLQKKLLISISEDLLPL
jgi:hypothetical protein